MHWLGRPRVSKAKVHTIAALIDSDRCQAMNNLLNQWG